MAKAKQRIPGFAFDYLEGGVGDENCIARNRKAFDSIEIIPKYGLDITATRTKRTLFGRDYSMPVGVAPMGLAGLVWPNADAWMATAAENADIPFVLSMVSNIDIETATQMAPNTIWLQIYAVPKNDYELVFDMVARAEKAGVNALVLTLDTPMRQKRLRDLSNGLTVPFKPTLKTVYQVARSPSWALETLKYGQPRFANFVPYAGERSRAIDVATYVHEHMSGPTTWELVKRVRTKWKGPLILKGPQLIGDASLALEEGVDGLIISNHGGRQFDAAPAAIDVLHGLKRELGSRFPIMLDGSVYSGLDVMKAMICGADFVFAGRPFLAASAALGKIGPSHMASVYRAELRAVMAQAGIVDITDTEGVNYRMSRWMPFVEKREKTV
jgi:L-lactate dehydrogenase (cytochrome)